MFLDVAIAVGMVALFYVWAEGFIATVLKGLGDPWSRASSHEGLGRGREGRP